MEEENIAIRLKHFMDTNNISSSVFADTCGIPRPSLSQLLSGRNKKISDIIIGQIHSAYPELSIMWLLFGEGQMQLNTQNPDTPFERNAPGQNIQKTDIKQLSTSSSPSEEPITGRDTQENPSKITATQIESNLTPLNDTGNNIQTSDLHNNPHSGYAAELLSQIDKLKKNPRKVVQIMIYYDDSTFETFLPGK